MAHAVIGTKRMLELLQKITEGKGEHKQILDKLEETAKFIQSRSLCGLGKECTASCYQYASELPSMNMKNILWKINVVPMYVRL